MRTAGAQNPVRLMVRELLTGPVARGGVEGPLIHPEAQPGQQTGQCDRKEVKEKPYNPRDTATLMNDHL